MSLGFRHSTAFAGCLFALPFCLPRLPAHTHTPAGQGILTCAIISSALWTLFLLRCRIQLGFFWLCFCARLGTIRVLLLRWMTAIKADTLTHTHMYTRSLGHTTLTWRGVAILSHEHTLLIRNVGHRLPSLPSLWPRCLH